MIYYYIYSYANLGSTSSQRSESYHPVIYKITNDQLSFEELSKRLIVIVLSILKDLSTFKHRSMRAYNRRVQFNYTAFRNLAYTISNFTLKKIEAEWNNMKTSEEETLGTPLLLILYIFTHKIDV
jgi:hypothetical protein